MAEKHPYEKRDITGKESKGEVEMNNAIRRAFFRNTHTVEMSEPKKDEKRGTGGS